MHLKDFSATALVESVEESLDSAGLEGPSRGLLELSMQSAVSSMDLQGIQSIFNDRFYVGKHIIKSTTQRILRNKKALAFAAEASSEEVMLDLCSQVMRKVCAATL